jgi:DsbC/DsbD-like thiol-disulfide interchange protein
MPLHSLALLTVLLATGAAAVAEPVQAKHARLELLAEQNAVAPGADLLLGIRFVLEPGWHIYWVNPGDSGQPPVLTWQLPTGFSASETRWPRPERMQSSPQLADYGYHDDVLLMVAVHAPPQIGNTKPGNTKPGNAKPGNVQPGAGAGDGGVGFAVDVKWLICREVCFPDHTQLRLALPLGSSATVNPATAAIFAGARKLLPKLLPPGWKTSAESRKDEFVLSVRTGKSIARADFFPLEPAQLENAAPQKLVPAANGAKITLRKSDLLLKPVAVLRGVLVLPGGDAYRVEAPVTAAQGIK